MRKVKSIVVIFVLAFATSIVARAQRVESNSRHFELGEELLFEAEFSRALLRKIDVADLKFRATRTPVEDAGSKPYALTFNADVASKGFFARLFNLKFRERVESTV